MKRFENFDFEDFDFEEESNLLTKEELISKTIVFSNSIECKQISIKLKNMGFGVYNHEQIMETINEKIWRSFIYDHGHWVRTKKTPISGITIDDF